MAAIRILMVDDDSALLEVCGQLLERLGYRVEATTDSPKALARIESEPDYFDLVVSDQTMPGLTGAELTERIRRINPDLPIILCTGFSETLTPENASRLGAQGFLFKPVSMRKLAEAIRSVLDARKPEGRD